MYGSASPDNLNPSGRHINGRIPANLLESVPSAAEIRKDRRSRDIRFLVSSLISALVVGGSFIFMGNDSAALPFVLLAVVATPILLWRFRTLPIYIALISACLFELYPSPAPDEFTGKTFFFLNINTIFQSRGVAMEGMPVSIFEVILGTAGLSSLFQGIFGKRVRIQLGTLFPAMATYLLMVTLNYIRGWADGSDYHIMLQEVRAQFYLAIAYLMALNMVEERKDIGRILWFSALCIGLKGILYTYRRYITLGNGEIGDQGVGSHEEAFFFNCFVGLLLTLWLCRYQPKLTRLMWVLLPTTVLGFLATNRRAGTAGFIVAVPVIILAAYRGLPERRRLAAILGILCVTLGPAYYHTFKNSSSQIAQPARAVKSHFEPDERDAASNAYRDAENANIMATVKQSLPTTLFGYGYGKPFFKVFPMVDIGNLYDKWDILPHNQILWIWMRTGFVGLLAFFALVSTALIRCMQVLRRPSGDDREYRALAIWTSGVLVMLVVFGMLDLQISNYRNMIFVGLLLGLLEGHRLRSRERDELVAPSTALARVEAGDS